MIGTKDQQNSFKNRLGRIKAGGQNTTRHVYVGPPDEDRRSTGKAGRAPALPRQAGQRRFAGELMMIPLGVASGALAVLAARVVSFRFLTEQSFYTSEYFGIAGSVLTVTGLAIAFAFLLRVLFRLSGGVRGRAEFAGFAGMVLFEHMAIVRLPEIFTQIYSDGYVAQVIAQFG
jgi:hypothetical protein